MSAVAGFNNVRASSPVIYRDIAVSNNAVWLATSDGLEKYDKVSGTSEKFASRTFSDLFSVVATPDDNVVVGSYGQGGVAEFDGKSFNSLSIGLDDISYVSSLALADGLWIGLATSILHKYDETWKIFDCPDLFSSIHSFNAFAYDAQRNRIWFGASGARKSYIGYINGKGKIFFLDDFKASVNRLYCTPDGILYIATDNGMYICKDNVISPLEHAVEDLDEACTAVTGNNEKVWFSSKKTIVQYDGHDYRAFTCDLSEASSDFIYGLVADGDKVWVMMLYGGLFEFKDNKFSEPTPGITNIPVVNLNPVADEDLDTTVYRDMTVSESEVWIATANGLVKYDKQTGNSSLFSSDAFKNLSALALSPENEVTVGARDNAGVAKFENGMFNAIKTGAEEIVNVSALAYGNGLWVGSDNLLQQFTDEGWKILDAADIYSAYNQYNCLTYDETTGDMWFGAYSTRNSYKYGYVNKNSKVFLSESPSYNVNGIYLLHPDHVYLATDGGLLTDKNVDNPLFSHLSEIYNITEKCRAVTGDGNMIWFAYGNKLGQCSVNDYQTYECNLSDCSDDYIVRLATDKDRLWVLMAYDGLFEFKDNEFFKVNLDNTDVQNIMVDPEADTLIYDLFGHRLSTPAKGQVYIRNGQKYVGR